MQKIMGNGYSLQKYQSSDRFGRKILKIITQISFY